jgi:hypothetical protein
MIPVNNCLKSEGAKLRKSNREGKFDQSVLYACMEIS